MAYSKDLREKVMEYMTKGHTQEETSQVLNVSVSAIKEWNKLHKGTGSLPKRKLNRKPRKYTLEKMEEILAGKPGAYLSEIAERFEEGTTSGVHKALKRMEITVKKNDILQRTQRRRKSRIRKNYSRYSPCKTYLCG